MAVQYNSDTDSWTTWIDKLKQEVPTVKKEISEFFELMNAQGVPLNKWAKSNDEVFDKLCKKYKVTDTELKNFLRTWDDSGDIQEAFTARMKESTEGLTLFQRAGKAAGTAVKSLVATAGSMLVSWGVGEVISLIVKPTYEFYISTKTLNDLCQILQYDICDIVQYVPSDTDQPL